ncbi:hypothetical protein QUF72_08210 [Desulfobacterales bacterium HSG2]|nr:hypothetical protein [Desulfobacterales bacterium HSG2]
MLLNGYFDISDEKKWIPAFQVNQLSSFEVLEVNQLKLLDDAGMTWFCYLKTGCQS